MNLKDELLKVAGDEPILAVVIGEKYAYKNDTPTIGKVVSWDDAYPLLDFDWEMGDDMAAVTTWTPTRVLFMCEYDGEISLSSVFRNPTEPELF